ncbi:presenilin-like protein At1g08700 isoform X2 [Telopea speciosissima]|uniref:presenilin-like protein At1g08700 isoform X2 n=1 Tax=Telopea speciosissima TaxID=54955 RepID=UPI001CC7FF00|nr:presenilin-like protein At1g08700 isoform X2 [Telopea speciosissima]
METSILESIGVEIIGVMSPVSICMLLVVFLVYTLTPASPDPVPIRSAATLVYLENPSDSTAQKFEGALLNAAVFVILIAAVTFLLVVLYYYNFNNFLKNYMRFSAFFVLGSMGGSIFLSIIQHFSIPIDSITCSILLFNFTVVGVLSVFSGGIPIFLRQGYMVLLGIIVAAWFSKLPEWTTWVLLVALAVYDLVAVLAPGGPLKLLVELASSRDEELPALVYEARPTVSPNHGGRGSSTASALGLLVTGSLESGSVELQPVPRNNGNRLGVVDAADLRARQIDNRRVDEESTPLVSCSAEGRPTSSGGFESDYSTENVGSLQAQLYGNQDSEIVVDEEMSPLVNMRLGSEREQTDNWGGRSSGTEIPVIETREG